MNYGELPIFRAPDDKKVAGFSIVEDFFVDLDRNQSPAPISNDVLFRHPRGVFQALTLLMDFGHLEEVNLFVRTNPLILKTSFELKDIELNSAGEIVASDHYTPYSPLLVMAPYFVRKGRIGNKILSKRKVFYSYENADDMASRYTRDELMSSLALWLQMGLDIITRGGDDDVIHSLMDLAIDMEFDSAYLDVILKYSLSSPMYHDLGGNSEATRFRTDAAIRLYKACMVHLDNLDQVSDAEAQQEMRYVALLLNTYFKHEGHALFSTEAVKEGNLTEVKTGLEPYISHQWLTQGAFGRFIEIVYIVLRAEHVFDDPHVLMVDTMKLLMEVHDIDPITALTMVKNDDQRDVLMDILKGD